MPYITFKDTVFKAIYQLNTTWNGRWLWIITYEMVL